MNDDGMQNSQTALATGTFWSTTTTYRGYHLVLVIKNNYCVMISELHGVRDVIARAM